MTQVITFSQEKNEILKNVRGICFDDILHSIVSGKILDSLPHWNLEKYPNQRVYVVEVETYVYLVPYIENKDEIFLKTVVPSRKFTKIYLNK